MRMTYQNLGSKLLLFLYGTKEEIVGRHNSLFNWGATNGELNWSTDNSATVLITGDKKTPEEKLRHYFFNVEVMRLMRLCDTCGISKKGRKYGVASQVKTIAERRFNEVTKEPNPIEWGKTLDPFETGIIAAEKPDMDLKDYFISKGLEAK